MEATCDIMPLGEWAMIIGSLGSVFGMDFKNNKARGLRLGVFSGRKGLPR